MNSTQGRPDAYPIHTNRTRVEVETYGLNSLIDFNLQKPNEDES